MASILDQGDYKVYLDAGFLIDAFRLDYSVLDGTDVLDGSTAYFDVTSYVQQVSISRGRQKYRQPIDAALAHGDYAVISPRAREGYTLHPSIETLLHALVPRAPGKRAAAVRLQAWRTSSQFCSNGTVQGASGTSWAGLEPWARRCSFSGAPVVGHASTSSSCRLRISPGARPLPS